MIAKPNLLPKTPYKSKAKPPKPRGKKPNDSFAKSKLGSNISSAKSKRPQSKKSDISDQKSSTMLKGNSNIRSIASNAPRPQTTKKLMKRTMPVRFP